MSLHDKSVIINSIIGSKFFLVYTAPNLLQLVILLPLRSFSLTSSSSYPRHLLNTHNADVLSLNIFSKSNKEYYINYPNVLILYFYNVSNTLPPNPLNFLILTYSSALYVYYYVIIVKPDGLFIPDAVLASILLYDIPALHVYFNFNNISYYIYYIILPPINNPLSNSV